MEGKDEGFKFNRRWFEYADDTSKGRPFASSSTTVPLFTVRYQDFSPHLKWD